MGDLMSNDRRSVSELAAEPLDSEDSQVLDRVAEVYLRTDPVPDGLVERIQFGITLDALHAEVAELQRGGALVGVRAEEVTEAQTVTFASASLTAMVTITPTAGDRVRVDGWLAPGANAAVELRQPAGDRHVQADEDGRFVFDDVPRGLTQFVIRPLAHEARPVVTPSIEL
jgi:hypothetical protein